MQQYMGRLLSFIAIYKLTNANNSYTNNSCTNLIAEANNWKSWSSDVTTLTPVFRPVNDDELTTIVQKSKKNGCKIRMTGAGHSEGGMVMQRREENIVVISLASHETQVSGWNDSINPATSTFRIGAGKSWYDVSLLIRPNGFIVKNRSAGKFFSVGGVISNNVHGGGRSAGFVHDDIVRLLVLTSDGNFVEVFEESELKYWRSSAGQLGIIIAVEMSMHSEAIPAVIGIDENTGEPILDESKGGLNMERERLVYDTPTNPEAFTAFITGISDKAYETNSRNEYSMFFFNFYTNVLAIYKTNYLGPRFSGFTGSHANVLLATQYQIAAETLQSINNDVAYNGGNRLDITEESLCLLFCVPPSAPPFCIPIPSQTDPSKLLCDVPQEASAALSAATLDFYDQAWDTAASTVNDGYAEFPLSLYKTLNVIFPARAFPSALTTFYQAYAASLQFTPNCNLVFRFINPTETAILNPIPTIEEIKADFDAKYSFLPNAFDSLIPLVDDRIVDGLVVFDLENQNVYDDNIHDFFFAMQQAFQMIPTNPSFPYDGTSILPECNAEKGITLCHESNLQAVCCNPPIPAYFGHFGKAWAYNDDPTTTPTTGQLQPFQDSHVMSNLFTVGSKVNSINDFNAKRDEYKSLNIFSGGKLLQWLDPSSLPETSFEIRKLSGQTCGSMLFSSDPNVECLSNACVNDICSDKKKNKKKKKKRKKKRKKKKTKKMKRIS